ncbi:MAG: GNAT family N-acetyltransferase [Candidatus Riflebacteria bacterium]|jgi:ribosomal protein S18 acetylase RimI-like enzyme|nr:GNAT family N-acetyltransferase [Candidatus Riflebacteria bacterium]
MIADDDFVVRAPETPEEWNEYFALRWQVLRRPWKEPQGSERDEREDESWHRAVYIDRQLAGIARIQMNSLEEAQIRYMAVNPDFQKRGVGRALVVSLETIAREQGAEKVILDARSSAVGFYLVLGYTVIADSYLLFGEIQHYRMEKALY